MEEDKMARNRVNLAKAAIRLAIIGIAFVTVWFGFRYALGTTNPFYGVVSGSMIPTLQIGDVIIVSNGGVFEQVSRGDIIVFNRPPVHDRVIVHRVFSVTDNRQGLVTKGDNNPSPDSWVVKREDYIGKVIFTIPKLGLLTSLIPPPPVNYILVFLLLVLIFVIEFRDAKKSSRTNTAITKIFQSSFYESSFCNRPVVFGKLCLKILGLRADRKIEWFTKEISTLRPAVSLNFAVIAFPFRGSSW